MRQVLDFKQRRDLNLANVNSGGVCAACSLYYLLECSKGNEFADWIKDAANKAKVVNIHAGEKDPNAYMAKIYKMMDKEFDRTGTHKGKVHEIFKMMTYPASGALRWISFTSPSKRFFPSVGHAVAVSVVDGLRFFDPNFGEWAFDSLREFYPFVGGLFRREYHNRFYDGGLEIQFLDPL